jgi:hypothetical protein
MESPFSFQDVNSTGLELLENGKPVFVYNYGMILAPGFPERMRRSSYLHPVCAPDGTRLTDDFNPDHPHHRGISWMWPEITVDGKHGQTWEPGSFQQRFVRWKTRQADADAARLAVENGWYDGDRRFVREDVEILTHRTVHQQRVLDFTLRFEAVDRPVTIVGTPQGKKGFGGFCFRFAPRDGGSDKTIIRTEAGISKKDDVRAPHRWAEVSGTFHGRQAGGRIEDDPSNPRCPRNGWLTRHGFGFLNVSYPGLTPLTLELGKPLVLKYRVTLFSGESRKASDPFQAEEQPRSKTLDGPRPESNLTSLTLPLEKQPRWLREEGIVMAGDWEALFARARRDGGKDYVATAKQRAAYACEHTPEMVVRLKGLGINFVMMHCYRGAGLMAERESMADAARFAKLCHAAGLHVGVYVDRGTMFWELLFNEKPSARDWTILDFRGNPPTYGPQTARQLYRYWWDRNNPEAAAYHRQIVRFAVEDMGADLLHFDNYIAGPGAECNSVQRFRRHLAGTFTPAELAKMGVTELEAVRPPGGVTKLRHAWFDFYAQSLADSYHQMSAYARSLRSQVLVECNPGGPRHANPYIDLGRLLRGGEAFWDEGDIPGYRDGTLHTRIPTYKVARALDNIAFTYCLTPLALAESMAFNLDCLGCVCYFEGARPDSTKLISPSCEPYIRFFHRRRDLFTRGKMAADVAVLHSFPSRAFAGAEHAALTNRAEDFLIGNRVGFQIVFEHQLSDVRGCRALLLAGCVAMGDHEVAAIRRFVAAGGRLCVIGPLATHDQWMQPRPKPALADLPDAAVVRVEQQGDWLTAIRRACGGDFSMRVSEEMNAHGDEGLCAELTEQPSRRLVHLVNYRSDVTPRQIEVAVRVPAGQRAKSVTLASPDRLHDLPLASNQEGDVVRFTVPDVKTYEIAIIHY